MTTQLEIKTGTILQSIGFEIKVSKEKNIIDSANVIYCQFPIEKYRIDFALPRSQIAIEIDGFWHTTSLQKIRDREKDTYLRINGWKIIRLKPHNIDLHHINLALRTLMIL